MSAVLRLAARLCPKKPFTFFYQQSRVPAVGVSGAKSEPPYETVPWRLSEFFQRSAAHDPGHQPGRTSSSSRWRIAHWLHCSRRHEGGITMDTGSVFPSRDRAGQPPGTTSGTRECPACGRASLRRRGQEGSESAPEAGGPGSRRLPPSFRSGPSNVSGSEWNIPRAPYGVPGWSTVPATRKGVDRCYRTTTKDGREVCHRRRADRASRGGVDRVGTDWNKTARRLRRCPGAQRYSFCLRHDGSGGGGARCPMGTE